MTYKSATILQAVMATALTAGLGIALQKVGIIEDATKFVAGSALYLAWLARIRQDP